MTFSYDSFGNVQQSGNFNFQPPGGYATAANQPLPSTSWKFDAAGNLTNDYVQGIAYTWDPEGQLSSANGITYSYSAMGYRAGVSGSPGTDTIYFNGLLLARLSGTAWTDLVYGTDGVSAEVPSGGSPSYRFTDHLGSGVATESGGTVAIQDYAPFGQLFNGNATGDPYKFTGKERDAESGNDYFGASTVSSEIRNQG